MRHCYVVRVFTRDGNGGNPLGVVTDRTGLTAALMQRVAAELGFSETVYVDWRAGGDPSVRIFTPAAELPFAGHPLVGAAWLLNALGPGAARLECGVGVVEVRAEASGATIRVPRYPRPVEEAPDGVELTRACRLPVPVTVYRVRVPAPYLLVEAAGEDDVAGAAPDLGAVAGRPDVAGVYLYHRSDAVRARFFAPALGVDEDPATGSAAVALASVLNARGERSGRLDIAQGEEVGRPSRILLSWTGESVEIGGGVVRDEVRELDV